MSEENKNLKRPILSSIFAMFGLIVVLFLAGMIAFITDISSEVTFFIAFSLIALIELFHIVSKKRYSVYGLKNFKSNNVNIIYFIPLYIIAFVPLFAGIRSELKISDFLYIVVYMFVVAFVEEVLYRGIILNNLKQKSIKYAVVGSAIMFGLSHLITVAGGSSPLDILYQVIMAFTVALILALIVLYTNNIYICIGYHFLNNVVASISGSFGKLDNTVSYVILLTFVVYVLILKNRFENISEEVLYD